MRFKNIWTFCLVSFWSILLLASPAQLTYQGRILKSDGTALEYNNVSFIFQVTDPQGTCIIYQEAITGYNMVNSGGVFDVPIGNGTINYPLVASFSVLDAFNNSSNYNCGSCSGYTCSNGSSTYTAASGDARKLRVQFYDGTGWKTISPDSVIRSVPFAGYAESAQKLGTNSASDFILKTGIPTCASGTFLSWDGTNLTCSGVAGASGGTVTNVTSANSYLTIINNTSTPELTLNIGTTANTVAAGNDPRLINAIQTGSSASGDLSGTYPGPSVVALRGIGLSSATPTMGQFLKFNGTNWTPATIGTSDVNGLSSSLSSYLTQSAFNGYVASASCGTSETMYWNSVSGTFLCQTINVGLAGDVTGSIGSTKVVALQNHPVDTTAPTSNQVLQWNGSKWAPATLPAGNAGTVTSVTGTAPISVLTGTSTPVISISQSSATTNGYLSSTDWTTFNNKQVAGNYVTALTGDVTASGPGSAAATVAKLQGSTLTITTPASGQYLRYNGSAFVNSALPATDIPNLDWSKITTGKPTTLSGYGITDSLVSNAGGAPSIQTGVDASKPASPSAGAIYFATDTKKIYQYNSSTWTVIASDAGAGGTITALTSDVSASGSGLVAATVNSVGGSTAAQIHSAEIAANAATNSNTASTIVKRDASGNFSAGTITASLTGAASLNVLKAGDSMTGSLTHAASTGDVYTAGSGANTVTLQGPTAAVTTSYILRLPTAQGSSNQVLTNDGSGNLSWTTPSTTATAYSGVLPVANGGTNSSTALTGNKVMVSNGTSIVEGPALGNGQLLIGSNGAAPVAASLTAGSGITITPAAGALTIATTGLMANSLADGKIWVGQSGTPTAVTPSADISMTNAGAFTVTALRGKSISTTAPSSAGQVLRYDGTSSYAPAFLGLADIRSTISPFGGAFANAACTTGQTLYWQSSTDNFQCQSIAISSSQVTFASQSANTFFAGPSGGSGTPTFRAITSADLPTGTLSGSGTAGYVPYYSTATTLANSVLYNSSSKIGVNTTSPAATLDVAGGAKFGTMTSGSTFADHTVILSNSGTAFQGGMIFANQSTVGTNKGIKLSEAYSSGVPALRIGEVALSDPNTFTRDYLYLANGNAGIGTTNPSTKLEVSANASTATGSAYGGRLIHVVGADGANSGIQIDAYGTSTSYRSLITFRQAEGTGAAPTATQANDILGSLGFWGYGATDFSANQRAEIKISAAENWSDTAQGTYMSFTTTPTGSATTSERMRILANGNIGIGTTSPGAKLSVNGNATNLAPVVSANIHVAGGDGQSSTLELDSFGNTATSAISTLQFIHANNTGASPSAIQSGDTLGQIIFSGYGASGYVPSSAAKIISTATENWTNSTGAANLLFLTRPSNSTSSSSERMRIDQNGNVGIGTQTPAFTLDVTGPARYNLVSNGSYSDFRVNNTSGTVGLYVASNGTVAVGTSVNPMATNAAGALSIYSNGTDGINLKQNSANNGVNVWNVSGGTAIAFYTGSGQTTAGIISTSGSTTTYGTSSDRRLKENIIDTSFGLADLLKIKVHDYNYISEKNKKRTGFIAQELYQIFPDAVAPNGDDGLSPLKKGATPWTVEYGKLTPLLVKSIQELKAEKDSEIAKLHDQVNALNSENDRLRKDNDEIKKRLDRIERSLSSVEK